MRADEERRVEAPLQAADRSAHQIGTARRVEADIFVLAADPVDGVDRDADEAARILQPELGLVARLLGMTGHCP